MVKLLIIDDEQVIRHGIRNRIDWTANGIEVCGEASNGQEALEMVDRLSPDILLVDIRMPVMNGLELIEAMHSSGRLVKSIILSGHDDFLYAQKAVKLGVSDYLLKPCLPQEILETVKKVKGEIESERTKRDLLDRYKAQLRESLPLLKEKYLTRLIKGENKYIGTIREKFELFRISLAAENIVAAVIRIDDFSRYAEKYSNEDLELFKFGVCNIVEETLRSSFSCEVFENNEDIVALVNTDDQNLEKIFTSLTAVQHNTKAFLDLTVSAGVGCCCKDILDVQHSYSQAIEALQARFFLTESCIILYEDVHTPDSTANPYPLQQEKALLDCIKAGSADDLNSRLELFFTAMNDIGCQKEQVLQYSQTLFFSVYRLCMEKGISMNEILGNNTTLTDIIRIDTVNQLKSKLYDIIKLTFDKLNTGKCHNKLVEAAVRFINENYTRDLNLDAVAKELYITPGYVSLLFKQVLGTHFVDYLHKTRVEKACEILRDIRVKTYEAASRVGYSDEKYFSQIFKKYTGMTPTQYRDSHTP